MDEASFYEEFGKVSGGGRISHMLSWILQTVRISWIWMQMLLVILGMDVACRFGSSYRRDIVRDCPHGTIRSAGILHPHYSSWIHHHPSTFRMKFYITSSRIFRIH